MTLVLPPRPPKGVPLAQQLIGGAVSGLSDYVSEREQQRLLKEQAQAKEAHELRKIETQERLKGERKQKEFQDIMQFIQSKKQGKQPFAGSFSPDEREPQSFRDRLMQEGGGEAGLPQTPEESMQQQEPEYFSEEDLAALATINPQAASMLQKEQDVGKREKREEKKEVTESFKENQKFIDKIYDQYEDALRKTSLLERGDQLNESGELSDSGIINLLDTLGLQPEWLKNPANEEYQKLMLDTLGGGTLQADYGNRILASEFAVSLKRIPQLSNTKEGRRQISENIKALLLPAKLKKERMQYYLDRQERTGKPLPHNLRGKILNDIQPQLEQAAEEFKLRNGRYKVREGTLPDDLAIEKYYFISDRNPEKAIKLMKEDGYKID